MSKHEKEIRSFDIYGDFIDAVPYGTGHINHTYKATFSQAGRKVNYLIQHINDRVFRNPEALMENISRICDHLTLKAKQEGIEEASRRVLTLVRSQDNLPWVRDAKGGYWRCYLFVEDAVGHDVIQNTTQAREAARCFGEYLGLLADLPGERLHETIPGFHDTPDRLDTLLKAVEEDPMDLLEGVRPDLDFFLERRDDVHILKNLEKAGKLPERVTHNDTKLNNVLIDTTSHLGVCVIDLDTSMPGLSLYDFGDLVRTSTSSVPEDHPHPEEVRMDMDMYKALAEGFLDGGSHFLNETEIAHLAEGGRLMTVEVGMRFLTDYLQGNPYFKIAYPEHNLVRCRTQIALAKSIEEQFAEMTAVSEAFVANRG